MPQKYAETPQKKTTPQLNEAFKVFLKNGNALKNS